MGICTEFRTEDLPTSERFAAWYELTLRSFVPSLISCEPSGDFRASTRILELGPLQVASIAAPSLQMHRPRRLIRRSDPEQRMFWLHLNGTFDLTTGGGQASLRPGEIVMYDTSDPYHGMMLTDREAFRGIVVQAPRTLLPVPPATATGLKGRCLPGDSGIGGVLVRYLTGLMDHGNECRAAEVARLSTVTLELLTTFLDSHGDAELPPGTCAEALRIRIDDFVEAHLASPELSPDVIARAHRISTRYLHKLFQEQGRTVAAWVRTRRLERCRRDLADPALAHRSVSSIAMRWGFGNAAHFSRLFRTRHGMSPRDFRQVSQAVDG